MSKKPSSASVRVLSMAVVALAIGFASARPASAQAGYVVQDLGALAGDTSSVAWAINATWSAGRWASRARAPSCTRMPAAWSRCPACRTGPGRWPVTSTTRASSSARPTRHRPRPCGAWSGGSVQDLGTLDRLVQRGLGRQQPRSGRRLVLHERGNLGQHGFLYTQADGLVDLTPDSDSLCHGHQRRGSGDGLHARRLSRISLARWNIRGPGRPCPGSRTASDGPSTRPARWPAARPRPRVTANGSCGPRTAGGSRIWGAWASTTWVGASTHRDWWLASVGNP